MKIKSLPLYEYAELSPEAKQKALNYHRKHGFDSYGLQVYLDEAIQPLLKKHGIVPLSTADQKYETKYAKIYYSLSNSQGDGVMFEGTFTWRDWVVNIRHHGHYYHSYSKMITIENDEGLEPSDEDESAFETIYQAICKELEKTGYAYIEDMESEEYFIEECNANEYLFRKDGTRESIES